MVGKAIAGEETILFTTNKDADEPKKTVIEMPNRNALVRTLTPCPPKWANYVRGENLHTRFPPNSNRIRPQV